MYTRYLHRKRGARYLCSPSPPLERTHLGGVVNSASEGGRRTDISAFCPRSLESHFNARIDAWNAPSCPFFPFFLPSPSPRLEPLGRSPPTLLPPRNSLPRKKKDTKRCRSLLAQRSSLLAFERKNSEETRYHHPYFFHSTRHRDAKGPPRAINSYEGYLHIFRLDASFKPSTTSPIRDRKTLGIGSRRGCGSFHGFVKEGRYEG